MKSRKRIWIAALCLLSATVVIARNTHQKARGTGRHLSHHLSLRSLIALPRDSFCGGELILPIGPALRLDIELPASASERRLWASQH